jgi:hypothetical protein
MPQLLSKGGSTSVRTRRGSLSGLTSSDAAAAASIGFARGPPQYINARCRLGNSRRRSTAVAFGAKRTLTEIAGEALAIAAFPRMAPLRTRKRLSIRSQI